MLQRKTKAIAQMEIAEKSEPCSNKNVAGGSIAECLFGRVYFRVITSKRSFHVSNS